jgi:hypothetical protein
MGHWGLKSYENDGAADALDLGFDRIHGALYEELMDDGNPLTFEQVQAKLADERTLAAAIEAVAEWADPPGPPDAWDEMSRLALVGVVVRHAELNIPIPSDWLQRALDWLEHEDIDWDEATLRSLRRQKELALLRRQPESARKADTAGEAPPDPGVPA